MALAEFVRQQYAPSVMVLTSPDADAICAKNRLSFVDLLRPHCHVTNLNVPVRTASEQPYRLYDFRIKVHEVRHMSQPPVEVAEEHLSQLVTNASDDAMAASQNQTPEQLASTLPSNSSDLFGPGWFQRYFREFFHMLEFSEHEAVDHPVASLLVVSSSSSDPVADCVKLDKSDRLPPLMSDGIMDSDCLKQYVLLHDAHTGPSDQAEQLLSEMRRAFGAPNCRLVITNTEPLDENGNRSTSQPDIWTPLRPVFPLPSFVSADAAAQTGRPALGACLSSTDLLQVSVFIHDLVEKALVPYMEQKIRNLHHQVSSSRKGLKSRITSLWGIRKEKKEIETDSNNLSNAYSTSSTEWQLRLLGDYAFMLRDYDLALNNYRQLSSDYKSDRAWKHYAGVQELMGLAAIMLDENHRESLPCFELAYTFYQRSGQLGTRYATRTALLLVEVLKAKRQYREAALVLTRASLEENNLRSGVLMEQAALCFLRLVPLSVRKYAFHMVLAGNRYNQCSQRKHAVRAYTQVLGVYASRRWAYIDDHVHFALGRQAAHLGDFPGAVQYFMKLLACGHQPAATQATYLREFLYVYQQAAEREKPGALAPLPLQLPVIDTGRVIVHFQDYRCHASDAAAAVPDDIWAELEEPLISPGFQETLSTWMDRGSAARLQSAVEEQTNLTVAGEEVGVDVVFFNCLKIPISVSDVRLLWTWTRPTKRSSRVHSVQGLNNDLLAPDSDTEEDTSGAVEAPAVAFSLKGGERTKVRLTIKPLKEGKVNVIGVDWLLSEVARGRQMFAIRGPLKKKQKEEGGQDRDYPPHMRLAFRVIQSMPRLEARIHELPSAVVQGELRRFVMELSNTGPASLKSLRMRTSHPAEVCAGEENDLDVEFSHCLSPSRHGRQNKTAKGGAESRGIIEFLGGGSLGGGSTLLWPLWLRMCSTGLQTVHLAFYYEAHAGTSVMKYRTLRVVCSLTVVASLKASARLLPSPTSLDRHLLRVDLHNLHLASAFFMNQVTAMPEQWQLLPLEELSSDSWSKSTKEAPLIRPGETSTLFFHVQLAYAELASVDFGEHQQQNGTGHPCELHLSSSIGTHVDLDAGPAHLFYLAERRLNALPGIASTTGRREDDLDVLFTWEVAGEPGAPRAGSLNVYGLSTQGPAPVRWALQGDSMIDHDFSSQPSCRAPLLFKVRNCSSTSVSVCLETSNPTAEPAAAADSGGWFAINSPQGATADTAASGAVSPTLPPVVSYAAITKHAERRDIGDLGSRMGVMPLTPYVWCGPSRVTLNHLPPGEQASIPLCTALFAPGVYDFSSYRVSWFVNNESAPSTPATPIADGAEGLDGNGSSVGQSFLVRVSDLRQEAKAAASTKSSSIAQQFDAFNVPPPPAAMPTHRQPTEPFSLLDL